MKRLATLATASILACGTLAAPADFATRVACELQTASGTSLQRLIWQQGTTPLLSIEQFRLGKAIPADPETDAIVVFGPSATSRYFVAVTNQSRSANSYLVQMPTIGTNAVAWWYTVYFERGGRRYWTGSGALTIEATTSTGDGLHWQEIAGDTVALTNWHAAVYSMTNGAALGVTALQPADTNGWEVGSHEGLASMAAVAAGDAANSNHVAEALGRFAETGTVSRAGMADRAGEADSADYAGYADEANEAMTANQANDAYTAYQLSPYTPDGQALNALKSHPTDPAAHPDIRAALDLIPTNTSNGWLVWDSGSNCFWRVVATNLRFYVWEAQ